jgi:hypothetical protein
VRKTLKKQNSDSNERSNNGRKTLKKPDNETERQIEKSKNSAISLQTTGADSLKHSSNQEVSNSSKAEV